MILKRIEWFIQNKINYLVEIIPCFFGKHVFIWTKNCLICGCHKENVLLVMRDKYGNIILDKNGVPLYKWR